jgi:FkbM family methyltransferase
MSTRQWLPSGATLHSATQSMLAQECVWAPARVNSTAWNMCTHPGHLDRHLSRVIQQRGCVECSDVAFMLERLKNGAAQKKRAGPLLVDCGANIGMYSLAAAAAGFSVVAFEPMPTNAVRLLASIRRNDMQQRVHLATLCLSDSTGTPCSLGLNPTNQGHLRHQIGSGAAAAVGGAGAATGDGDGDGAADRGSVLGGGLLTSVAVRLDDMLPAQSDEHPIFLKVDLEGHECRAFRGMTKLLNRSASILGALVEFDKSHECAPRLDPAWTPPGPPLDHPGPPLVGALVELGKSHECCAPMPACTQCIHRTLPYTYVKAPLSDHSILADLHCDRVLQVLRGDDSPTRRRVRAAPPPPWPLSTRRPRAGGLLLTRGALPCARHGTAGQPALEALPHVKNSPPSVIEPLLP